MAKHPIDDFPNSAGPQGTRRATSGCLCGETKDVNKYRPPMGPMGIMGNNRPGLGGTNHGNSGTQGKR